jgi:hypothetical protein
MLGVMLNNCGLFWNVGANFTIFKVWAFCCWRLVAVCRVVFFHQIHQTAENPDVEKRLGGVGQGLGALLGCPPCLFLRSGFSAV